MQQAAIFRTANGETIHGVVDGDHPECRDGDVVFVVEGRARRVGDLPPGRLAVPVPRRTLGAAALVHRAMRAGFDAWLDCAEIPDRRRAARRR